MLSHNLKNQSPGLAFEVSEEIQKTHEILQSALSLKWGVSASLNTALGL